MDAGLKEESDTEEWRLQGKAESREKQTRQSKGGKKKSDLVRLHKVMRHHSVPVRQIPPLPSSSHCQNNGIIYHASLNERGIPGKS